MDIFTEPKFIGWILIAVVFAVIFFGAVACLHFWLFKKHAFFQGEKGEARKEITKKWILRGVCLFVLFLEFYKHVVILRGDGIDSGDISIHTYPFQLCHMALLLFPFVAFGAKDNKFAKLLFPAAFCIGIIGGFISVVYPANILAAGRGWFNGGFMDLSLISVLYHTAMIIFAVYMVVSKAYKMKSFDAVKAIVVFLVLACIAITINAVVPGADFFMLGKGTGIPWAFLIDSVGGWFFTIVTLAIYSFGFAILYIVQHIKAIINLVKNKQNKAEPAIVIQQVPQVATESAMAEVAVAKEVEVKKVEVKKPASSKKATTSSNKVTTTKKPTTVKKSTTSTAKKK